MPASLWAQGSAYPNADPHRHSGGSGRKPRCAARLLGQKLQLGVPLVMDNQPVPADLRRDCREEPGRRPWIFGDSGT
jgi:hypothetical protein